MTKILLVEDDKSLREIYGVRLLAEGYDIVSAGDGEDALAMAIKERPQLIISDVMMPKISGFDMLDILRSTTETRDIKVIMMTALSSEDQRQRGEQLGADRYLVKSQIGIEDVVRAVHEVLEDSDGTAAPQLASSTPADNTTEPAATSPDPAASQPANDVTASATTAPGNDDAGPLPPQPTESVLPQPTAPFSSPRPANLGERVVQPLENPESTPATPLPADAATPDLDQATDANEELPSTSPEESAQLVNELQATPEPIVSSQVDDTLPDPSGDAVAPVNPPVTPETPYTPAPPVDAPADLGGLGVDNVPSQPQSTEDNPQATPPVNPGAPSL